MKETINIYNLIKDFNTEDNKYIIDIGALNIYNGNSKPFINKDYKVLLVEPNPDSIKGIKAELKNETKKDNVSLAEYAIYNYDGNVEFMNIDNVKGVSRIDNINFKKRKYKTTHKKIKVKCITYNTLMNKYPEFKNPFFIDIDVEGVDEIILKQIFDMKCFPNFISIEHQKVDHRIKEQKEIFTSNGYRHFKELEATSIWQKIN